MDKSEDLPETTDIIDLRDYRQHILHRYHSEKVIAVCLMYFPIRLVIITLSSNTFFLCMKLTRISFFSGKSRSAAIVPVLILSLLLAACNKDEEITVDAGAKPVIKLDSPTGIYSVKTGRELTISPDYENVTDAAFS